MRTRATPGYTATPRETTATAWVAVGEIHTGLLRNEASLNTDNTAQLLDLKPGEPVLQSQRPINHALSPDIASGVDCNLLTSTGARVRAVGTLLTHAAITGSRILQTSTYARIDPTGSQRRQPWPYYTARPGMLETLGRADAGELAVGFTEQSESSMPGSLDVTSVCDRLARRLQSSLLLDGRPPIRSQWTRTRWAAHYASAQDTYTTPHAGFVLRQNNVRTINLLVPYERRDAYQLDAVLELVRDLALHDWVLTTLSQRIERISSASRDRARAVQELHATASELLHLWMPGARVPPQLAEVWAGFERQPGFTRQWETAVGWVRDQVALRTLQLLSSFEQNTPPPR